MKVVIVNRHRDDALGGSEIQSDIVAQGLLSRGHEVVYVAVGGRGPYATRPYRVVPVAMTGQAISNACRGEYPTVVYWRFNKYCLRYVAKALATEKIPFVLAASHLNDLLPWRVKPSSQETVLSMLKRMLVERWNHSGYRWVSGVVCQTPEQLEAAPVRSSIVISNSGSLSRSIHFSWPRPYVAWVSNIKAAKRPELCLNLARRLLPHGVDLVMVGRMVDPSYDWLENSAANSENLYYIGPRRLDEVDGVLAGALALVHTCMPEGYPNVFIQAWLQGTPTVSLEFDPGGIIRNQGLGYVSGGDEQQFHQDVMKIITDTEAARQAGDKAKRYAREHCAPERNVAKLEAFLAEVSEGSVTASRLSADGA